MIKYTRHEFHASDQNGEAPLEVFLLDIPYLLMYGVIPPLPVINEILKSGGGDGGMSPGTSWEPFTITETEYKELVSCLLALDLNQMTQQMQVRFVPDEIIEDQSFNTISTHAEWLINISKKYKKKV